MSAFINRNRFGKLAIHGGIPVRDKPLQIGRNYEHIGQEEYQAVLNVLTSRSLFRYYGPNLQHKCRQLESEVADFLNVQNVLAVSSGTAALRCALVALGVEDGDEIIVPSHTFVASINAVILSGAKPIFVPIDDSLNIDPTGIEQAITSKTKAIMVVHLENQSADMDPITAIAKRYSLSIIEDACQAFGVHYRSRKVGTIGDIGCFSAQQEKNLSAGEGGFVVSNNSNLFYRSVLAHDQGGTVFTQKGIREYGIMNSGSSFSHNIIGENYRMSELSAAILQVQLSRVAEMLQKQKKNQSFIKSRLVESVPDIHFRSIANGAEDAGSSIVFFAKDGATAEKMVNAFSWEGIFARRFYQGSSACEFSNIKQWMAINCGMSQFRKMQETLQSAYKIGESTVMISVGADFDEADCLDVVDAVVKVNNAYCYKG